METTNETPTKWPLPDWAREFAKSFNSGERHCFLLNGNINDYAVSNIEMKKFLSGRLLSWSHCVAYYDRAHGITFPTKEHRDRFEALTEIGGQKEAQPGQNPLTVMKQQASGVLGATPAEAFPLLDKYLRQDHLRGEQRQAVALVIEHLDSLAPSGGMSSMNAEDRIALIYLQDWAKDPQIESNGCCILMAAPNIYDVHPSIRQSGSQVYPLEVPLPNYTSRHQFINALIDQADMNLEEGMTPEEFARLTAGVSNKGIDDIRMRGETSGGKITRELVKMMKDRITRDDYGDVISLPDPRFGWERIGGLEVVKNFFNKNVINPFRTGFSARMPMGILMVGCPGTGKSAVAEAVAKEAKVNYIQLNFNKILHGIVGSSEANLEKALQCIARLTPCIVFIDEFDQTVQRQGATQGDSGVSARIFGRLLQFMSDTTNRGKVVFLAATNRSDLLDPAIKREGRFDKKIAFLPPTSQERVTILDVMVKNYVSDEYPWTKEIYDEFVEDSEGWTGAEIEALVVKTNELLMDEECSDIGEAILAAMGRFIPTGKGAYASMTQAALRDVNDTDLLPDYWKEVFKKTREKGVKKEEEKVEEQEVVDASWERRKARQVVEE